MSKQSMIEHAKRYGRSGLSAYLIGEIEAILSYDKESFKVRTATALQSIKNYDEVVNDESLPWDWSEVKKNEEKQSEV